MTKQTKSAMNRSNPGLPPPVADETIVSVYPLELMADIAARVLSGTDYIKAAKTALALLDACQKELQEQTLNRAIVRAAEEQRKAGYAAIERDHNGEFVIKSFKEALKRITGEDREERAFPKYKRFQAHQIRQSRATNNRLDINNVEVPTADEVEASIKDYKDNGMRHDIMLGQQTAFKAWKKVDAREIARKRALGNAQRKNKPQIFLAADSAG